MIEELVASENCEELKVAWSSGEETVLPATLLRREARDAWSIREKIDTGEIRVMPGIQITALIQIGREGVNVHFSDGHERAIYPFCYLRELSDRLDN